MRRVLAVVPDLFFATKIAATAKALGIELATASLPRAGVAIAEAADRGEPFALVVIDLHVPGDAIERVLAARNAHGAARAPVVGFYSHVESARRDAALAAGVDLVLPRSAFTARLAPILRGEPSALSKGDAP